MEAFLLFLVIACIVGILLFARVSRNNTGKRNPKSGGGSGSGEVKDNNQGDQSY